MKRLFFLVTLLTCLTGRQAFFTIPIASAYTDIAPGSALEQELSDLTKSGVLKGYPDGTFKPNQTINRAEALKIIFAVQGISTDDAYDSSFPDVSRDDWFSPYVGIAKGKGIIAGYPDGTYRPRQDVNRAEFIKIMISSLPYFSSSEQDLSIVLHQFSDIDRKEWYVPYLSTALQLKLLPDSKQFKPTAGMKRGDAAEIIYRMMHYLGDDHSSARQESKIPFVPEDAFVVIDPTVEHPYHPEEFGPDKLTVEKDINDTEINNTYGGYHISIDAIVDVKNLEASPDRLTITYPEGCVVDIHTKDNSDHLTAQQYFELNFGDNSFMNPPASKVLTKLGAFSGFEAYKMVARWDDHSREDYFILTPERIYGMNGFSFGKKTDPECNELSNTIISNFELQ